MKKNTYKLWIIAFVIIVILGIVSIVHIPDISLETSDGNMQEISLDEYDMESIDESSGMLSEVKHDFNNFLSIIGDLFSTLFQGKESRYNSGINALRGKEPVVIKEVIAQEPTENSDSLPKKETISESFQGESKEKVVLTECVVKHVVDGDTIYVDIGGNELKVRLIGIDTPESVHTDESKNTKAGELASQHTKSILSEGMVVYLEYDIAIMDKYDRTLAYVWLSDDTSDLLNMLNARILSDGYAIDKVYAPNNKYAKEFSEISAEACSQKKGLWSQEEVETLWKGE